MQISTVKLCKPLVLAVTLVLSGCGGSGGSQTSVTPTPVVDVEQTLEQKLQSVDDYFAQLQQSGEFNGAVLLARDGEVLLMNSYGFTDVSKTQTLTNQSSFRLASVSKQFTTMAVMILEQQNLLGFDDLITKHLSELPASYENITIEHLMHHTSGIEDYTSFPENYVTELGAEFMDMAVFFKIIEQHPLQHEFAPGEQFSYSNSGYIMLAEIVARVSGQSFEDFMHNAIFEPLQMNNSDVWNLLSDPNSSRLPNRTESFIGETGLPHSYLDGIAGDGGVFASIEDLLKWDQALYSEQLVSQQLIKKAFTPATLNNGSTSDYGYGWIVDQQDNNQYVMHSGGWLGARTMLIRNLTNKTLLVILDSSSTTKIGASIDFINNALEGEGF